MHRVEKVFSLFKTKSTESLILPMECYSILKTGHCVWLEVPSSFPWSAFENNTTNGKKSRQGKLVRSFVFDKRLEYLPVHFGLLNYDLR